jgi:glyoxylase-like metal-dependent hydrolase (beta-lactamase superfamily II)
MSPSGSETAAAWSSRMLDDGVHVVLAANPGPLTLDGTNSYVLTTSAGSVVVDPGPALDDHQAALERLAPDLVLVLLTHGHADHSESAFDLAERHGAPVRAIDPAWSARAQPLHAGEVVAVAELTLSVIATPGHTADSVTFVGRRGSGRRLALTGDTVLGRGSTFVAHPEGRLVDYLASLATLAERVDSDTAVLPGHGPVRDAAAGLVSAYRRHREQRLDEVRSAWIAGARSDEEVRAAVYGEQTGVLRAAALSSTRAQLAYLGLLRED